MVDAEKKLGDTPRYEDDKDSELAETEGAGRGGKVGGTPGTPRGTALTMRGARCPSKCAITGLFSG